MKKYYLNMMTALMVAILSFGFASCSSDDDDNNGSSSKIVGVWYETYYWDTGTFSGNPNTWHTWGFVSPYVHEFKVDKTYKKYNSISDYKAGKVDVSGTYTFDGQYLAVNGGFKRKITFTESGDGFEWEQNAICVRYSAN